MSTTSASTFEPPPSRPRAPASRRPDGTSTRSESKPSERKQGRLKQAWPLLKETVSQWQEDEAPRQAASLAFYTLLSIAPLLVVSIKVAGMALGEEAARGQIASEVSSVVGTQAGEAIQAMIANARAPSEGVIGSVVGIVVLLFGASAVFGELQAALNRMWEVKPKPGRGVMGFIRDRFFSFTMVMGVAFLLLVSLVVSVVLETVTEHFENVIPFPALWQILNLGIALGITTVLFALIFHVVPDAKVAWRDVWVGAFFTAALFSVGKILLGWYVARSATVSPFGAAGSLVALIVWVYYSAQILFFGAEFTQVYATRFGACITPSDDAVELSQR